MKKIDIKIFLFSIHKKQDFSFFFVSYFYFNHEIVYLWNRRNKQRINEVGQTLQNRIENFHFLSYRLSNSILIIYSAQQSWHLNHNKRGFKNPLIVMDFIRRPSSLSELTPIVFNMKLTNVGYEASI